MTRAGLKPPPLQVNFMGISPSSMNSGLEMVSFVCSIAVFSGSTENLMPAPGSCRLAADELAQQNGISELKLKELALFLGVVCTECIIDPGEDTVGLIIKRIPV